MSDSRNDLTALLDALVALKARFASAGLVTPPDLDVLENAVRGLECLQRTHPYPEVRAWIGQRVRALEQDYGSRIEPAMRARLVALLGGRR